MNWKYKNKEESMIQIFDGDERLVCVLENHKANIPILIPIFPKKKSKFRYHTPMKAAKAKKNAKSKRRMVKQSRKHKR